MGIKVLAALYTIAIFHIQCPMLSVCLNAPCKINLHLRVQERRPDGFHDLESIFLALDFGDTLSFELGDEGQEDEFVTMDSRPRLEGQEAGGVLGELSGPDNIARRAAALFRARTGFDRPLRMRLDKRIPLSAGLGGGSSDAAASLLALNDLARRAGHPQTLGGAELRAAAAELGSDVPFFLDVLDAGGACGGAAWVTGRGERIQPVEGPRDCAVALAIPGFPSSTAEAYRLLDRRRDKPGAAAGRRTGPSGQDLIEALKGPPSRWPYGNDFLEVFLAEHTASAIAYRTILERLREEGADFCGLAGSGSTCFGIFAGGGGVAEKAAEALRAGKGPRKPGVCTVMTFPLAYLGKRVV
jgi:4-diphosphocytidyl-2-C-methyl-D-erythritol kinase